MAFSYRKKIVIFSFARKSECNRVVQFHAASHLEWIASLFNSIGTVGGLVKAYLKVSIFLFRRSFSSATVTLKHSRAIFALMAVIFRARRAFDLNRLHIRISIFFVNIFLYITLYSIGIRLIYFLFVWQ